MPTHVAPDPPVRWVLLSLSAVNFIVFARAIRSGFARPHGMPREMVALSAAGTAGAVVHLTALWFDDLAAPPRLVLAAAALLISLAFFVWAWRTIRHDPLPIAFSEPEMPTTVVQTGPFALVRHPFYLSYALTWLAGVLAVPSVPVVLVTGTLLSVYWHLANAEERALLEHDRCGAYRSYASVTPKFVPRRLWSTGDSANESGR
jgi:protein-S-isoprenylcysteine O-methyltransferase Ste14